MKFSKLGLILLAITVIITFIEADNGRQSSRSRTGNAETRLRGGYSHRRDPHRQSDRRTQALRVRRPNETPIRPGTPARTPAVLPSPEISAWARPRPSQAQRELMFVLPLRNMRRPDTAADGRRIRHSNGARRRGTQSKRHSSRVKRPNETPIRPGTPARRPASPPEASAWGGTRSSQAQRELIFVSPERFMQTRGRPRTVRTNPRGGHSRRTSSQGMNFGRMQALGRREA